MSDAFFHGLKIKSAETPASLFSQLVELCLKKLRSDLEEATLDRDSLAAVLNVYREQGKCHPSEYGVCPTHQDYCDKIDRLQAEITKWEECLKWLDYVATLPAAPARPDEPVAPMPEPEHKWFKWTKRYD